MDFKVKEFSRKEGVSEAMKKFAVAFKDFVKALAVFVHDITPKAEAFFPDFKSVDRNKLAIAVVSFALGSVFQNRPRAFTELVNWFSALLEAFKAVEKDQPSPPLETSEVLYKRLREMPDKGSFREALTVHSDIVATGTPHNSSAVRLFKKDAVSGFVYVGMGIRVSDDNLWLPNHVMRYLTDSEFKMKGANREVATLTYDKSLIVRESPIEEDDYVVYKVGKVAFTRTGTAKAKIRDLKLDQRVYVNACHEGTEHGTVAEGLISQTPYNFAFYGSYSSVPGHSGAEVLQLDKGSKCVVGMHVAAKNVDGVVKNIFISSHVLNDYTKSLESAPSTVSSTATHQSEIDARERIKAMQEAAEYQAKAKQRGDHRFDDGELEDSWAESNAEAALRSYRANREEFVQNFSYSRTKGWIRAGGKAKGGKMTKYGESSLLKGLQRMTAPLTQMSRQEESKKTLSQTSTKQDSSEQVKVQESQKADSSKSQEPQTPSVSASQNKQASILEYLTQELESGRTSKSQLRQLVNGLKVSEKASSKPSSTEQTPQ